jgi:hypothetical protein
MIEGKKAVVVIPFYKNTLTDFDKIALQQCFKILKDHPIVAIKPFGLTLPGEAKACNFLKVVDFDDDYFKNVQGYNRLMLDSIFYKAFLDYEFILIYQLDAFVFKDELDEWCNKGFDYIGAPWIRAADQGILNIIKRKIQQYIHTRYNIQKNGGPSPRQLEYKVGNGGFSLRRVHKFYELCIQYREMIAHYNKHDTHFFNEDVFWSVEVNRKSKQLKIPGYKIALKFAVELHPKRAFAINKNQLPFGCHAWDLTIDFWRPIFEQYGYKLNNKNGE